MDVPGQQWSILTTLPPVNPTFTVLGEFENLNDARKVANDFKQAKPFIFLTSFTEKLSVSQSTTEVVK